MLAFFTAQVLYLLFAFFMGNKECEYILERKHYAPHDSPYDDPFHTFGYLACVVMGAACTLFQTCTTGYVLTPFTGIAIIWLVYDVAVGARAFGSMYYLGTTSKTDQWLLTHFGKEAGKRKVQVLAGAVVLLNLLFILL